MRRVEVPVRVALAGCGTVGGALAARVVETQLLGRPMCLTRVLVRDTRRPRPVPLAPGVLTNDCAAFLSTPADIVVEALGGLEPALTIARDVLGRGGVFITANKALVAAHGPELQALARASGGSLGIEASVCGGVPVVRTVRDTLAGQPIRSMRGILNGTSNYLLTCIEGGASAAAALASARERGLAEADPTRDLDGRDIADKLAILAWVAWGVDPAEVVVRREALPADLTEAVLCAAGRGGCLRFVGECRHEGGRVSATVRPEVVAHDSPLARTRFEANHLDIDLGWGAPLALSGLGAGGTPTASALWSDLQHLRGAA